MAESRIVGTSAGNRGKGRKKGVPNKITALLKDAIIQAAEAEGRDGEGKDGLLGYCRKLANEEPRAFATLLGRVLPLQLSDDDGQAVGITFHTYYESEPGKWTEKPSRTA